MSYTCVLGKLSSTWLSPYQVKLNELRSDLLNLQIYLDAMILQILDLIWLSVKTKQNKTKLIFYWVLEQTRKDLRVCAHCFGILGILKLRLLESRWAETRQWWKHLHSCPWVLLVPTCRSLIRPVQSRDPFSGRRQSASASISTNQSYMDITIIVFAICKMSNLIFPAEWRH